MKKALKIPGAPAPIGPYSQAILSRNTLYVSGQIPLNPETGVLVDGSLTESTHQVMKNIGSLLNEANLSFDDIVKCTIFLKDLDNFNEVNKIYATYFRSTPPARETVEVSKLPMDVEIEISCIAVQD
ncbi:RidA family protein [Crocinitomicaceae bacterium]|nr:RidA family protein [Crocinitomicaceae bacterium]MDB4323995.1 RidA family protein [Crocinitomicaceae bacterium]|tara:strand:+ start:370 stop:750 length:381 start_codon:yes stop_codon:yes gene_type:complete